MAGIYYFKLYKKTKNKEFMLDIAEALGNVKYDNI